MDFLRNQAGRVTKAFKELIMVADPGSIEGSWTTHDANVALYATLTRPSSSASSRPALPVEVVLQILEHPSRTILTSCVSTKYPTDALLRVRSNRSPHEVIRTPPLSADDARNARKIVFEMKGKDQGWSSHRSDYGTYNNTWSWYEAVVRRVKEGEDDLLEEVSRLELHRNRHAGIQIETYRTEFDTDHDLVKTLQRGDVIELDACARFLGWECHVYEAKIEVWSVDDLSEGKEIASAQNL